LKYNQNILNDNNIYTNEGDTGINKSIITPNANMKTNIRNTRYNNNNNIIDRNDGSTALVTAAEGINDVVFPEKENDDTNDNNRRPNFQYIASTQVTTNYNNTFKKNKQRETNEQISNQKTQATKIVHQNILTLLLNQDILDHH